MVQRLSWKMTPEVAGVCLLAASEVPNFLAGALPSFMTIGRFAAEPEDVKRLRDGELWAAVPIIAVGLGTSLVFKNYWPATVCTITAVYYYIGYERHIRNPSPSAQSINGQEGQQDQEQPSWP